MKRESILHQSKRILAVLSMSVLLLATVPAPAASSGGVSVVDDTGRTVSLAAPARRIVSLSPHNTENLFAAGAGERVVGVSAYSDYPAAARERPRVGGFGSMSLEAVLGLRPDLVVAWAGGNDPRLVARLERLGVPVFRSQPASLEDVAANLERLGRLAGTPGQARQAAGRLRAGRDALAAAHAEARPVRVFYQLWDQPLRTIGGGQLTDRLLAICGGVNVFGGLEVPAPQVGREAVIGAAPEVILLAGDAAERGHWREAWRDWPTIPAVAAGRLHFVDPDLTQRHTPRALEGARRICRRLDAARAGGAQSPR